MHVCDSACSWQATRESLTAIGYPVRLVDKIVGSDVVLIAGESFEIARHRAWSDGMIRICTRTGR